jgi:hypothetical protein
MRNAVDLQAAAVAGVAATAYRLLRTAPPDAQPADLLAVDWLAAVLAWGVPFALTGGVVAAVAAILLPGRPCRADLAAALRPLVWGSLAVLLALPLRPLVFQDPTPLLLTAGLGIGGLATGWRLIALVDGARAGAIAALTAMLVGLILAPLWPSPQGDEPHYLTVAHSLVEDGDLDVADDYADRVFAGYHPDALSPHSKPGLRPDSRYSMHGVGYAAFLAPAYAIGRQISPRMSVLLPRLQQVFVGALFGWIVVQLIAHFLGPACALRGALPVVALAPVIFAPLHLFPETVAMTLSAGSFLLLAKTPSTRRVLGAGVSLALLPWLGVKYLPLMLIVGLAGVVLGGVRSSRVMLLAAPVALSCIGHAAFTWTLYGSVLPSAVYLGAHPELGRQPGYGGDWWAYVADWRGAGSTLVGYFLDQKEGLLAVAPHFIVVAAGGVLVWRRDRRLAVALAMIAAAHLGPYALSQQLGGQSPPARPLLAVVWVLAIPLAAGLSVQLRPWSAALRAALVTLGAALTTVFLWDPSMLPHDYGVRASWLLRTVSPQGWDLWRWFPSWVNVTARPIGVNAFWLIVVVALAAVLVRAVWQRQLPEERAAPFQPAWAAATATLVALTGVGLVAAVSPLSDRHQGVEIAPGIQAWTLEGRPEVVWPERGGVWARPGARRQLILTTAVPFGRLEVEARSLVPTPVDLAVGNWRTATWLDAAVPFSDAVDPGVGREWMGRRIYRGWIQAASGATPAEVEGGEDWRQLGVRFTPRRLDDGTP